MAVKLPIISGHVNEETNKSSEDIKKKYTDLRKDTIKRLPQQGMSQDKIMERMKTSQEHSRKCYTEYKHSGATYSGDEKHWQMISDVMAMNIVSNTIHHD
jgi:hypothetical protein